MIILTCENPEEGLSIEDCPRRIRIRLTRIGKKRLEKWVRNCCRTCVFSSHKEHCPDDCKTLQIKMAIGVEE